MIKSGGSWSIWSIGGHVDVVCDLGMVIISSGTRQGDVDPAVALKVCDIWRNRFMNEKDYS